MVNVIKEKISELKPNLLSVIKELIHLEVKKVMKKKKNLTQPYMNFKITLVKWSISMMIKSNMDITYMHIWKIYLLKKTKQPMMFSEKLRTC